MRVIFAIFIATCSLIATYADALSHLDICRGQTEHLEYCIKHIIESLRPYLANGFPDLDIPSFEPYHIERTELNYKDQFYGTATFKNIIIHGLSNFRISNVQTTIDVHQIKFDMYFPHIHLYAFYEIIGKIFHIPIQQKENDISADFLDITAEIVVDSVYDELKYFKKYTVSVKLKDKDDKADKGDLYRNKREEPAISKTSFVNSIKAVMKPPILNKVVEIVSKVITDSMSKIQYPVSALGIQ